MSKPPYCRVFYAGLVYAEYSITTVPHGAELPDGVFVYMPYSNIFPTKWCLKDKTPVLLSDVPKTLLVINLLLDS